MSELSEQQLLQAWAKHRDEAAFGTLVRRYAGFVFGAAARRVGDASLAEEIAQDVFARLAHHAPRLAAHPTLAGWLHRATMLLALDRLRRRARHERKLAQFALLDMSTPQPDPWSAALPHLDEALDRLGLRDREVLMLHFAERLPFPEIARRLGATSDAWRMRVNRALTALAGLLRKKGVVIPTAMLSAGLVSAFAQAAPAALVTITTATLAHGGKADLLSTLIHAMQTTKTAKLAAAAALFVLVPAALFFQQNEISALEVRIASRRLERAEGNSDGYQNVSPESKLVSAGGWKNGIDLKRLGELALSTERLTGRGYFAARDIRQAVARLDKKNLAGLIETVLHSDMLPEPREKLLAQLLLELRRHDLALYADWYLKVLGEAVPNASYGDDFGDEFRTGAQAAFREWAGKDPAAAAKWANEHAAEWSRLQGSPLPRLRTAGLLLSDPPVALARMETMPIAECRSVIEEARQDDGKVPVMEVIQWANKRVDAFGRQSLIVEALFSQRPEDGQTRGEALESILAAFEFRSEDRLAIAIRTSRCAAAQGGTPEEARVGQFAWLERFLSAEKLSFAKGVLLGRSDDPVQAYHFLAAELDLSPDDAMVAGYIDAPSDLWGEIYASDTVQRAEAGFQLAIRVADPAKRIPLLETALAELRRKAPQRVDAMLETPGLVDIDRALLRAQNSSSNKK